ncbi:polysaccharide deacetylase family protein [Bradyrhizobium genosp. L]|uniref:polysaccharide deacetylase family protein n=1 Tax=Bradyrhizobium genosp. L TaxID=83637 RepID=UPI0018A33AFA|nr:polysaccharide deacetylase family protein [Bradyrhizobium genosp. L]QPF82971.1 polysaccharide deacetylase family protein [Bradyrhizobium genosp. L]
MDRPTGKLTIVMYHYVRPLKRTRFPRIKGLDLDLFEQQLGYLARHYSLVTMEQLIDAIDGRGELPPRPALLTFDDGYLDHYTYVLPKLVERKIQGSFFPPSCSAIDRKVLDVNKIHFILASNVDPDDLVATIETACRERAEEFGLQPIAHYREKYMVGNFLDPANVDYVKLMLQHALPSALRSELIEQLFSRHVAADEATFAGELYATVEQLRLMRGCGMHIGSHGSLHQWLGHLPREEQEADIDGSLALLDAVGVAPAYRSMCYPYGSYNDDTVSAIASRGFKLALTTEVALSETNAAARFRLPRLDTNHLPKDASAPVNEWTLAAET